MAFPFGHSNNHASGAQRCMNIRYYWSAKMRRADCDELCRVAGASALNAVSHNRANERIIFLGHRRDRPVPGLALPWVVRLSGAQTLAVVAAHLSVDVDSLAAAASMFFSRWVANTSQAFAITSSSRLASSSWKCWASCRHFSAFSRYRSTNSGKRQSPTARKPPEQNALKAALFLAATPQTLFSLFRITNG